MSSSSGRELSQMELQTYRVRKRNLTTFDSFSAGVRSPITQNRMRQARQDWAITDKMKVCSYSYSLDTLYIILDSARLEIIASGHTVNWRVHTNNIILPMLEICSNPCLLIHIDFDYKQEFFDRDTVLTQIMGQHIRYAPSPDELYLLWKSNHEICFNSLPLAEGGYFLHYYCVPAF